MVNKRKTAKKINKRKTSQMEKDEVIFEEANVDTEMIKDEQPRRFSNLTYLLALLLIVIGVLLFKNKDLVVAAMVDGKPIFSWQLNSILVKQYGKQTLDNLITEQLIKDQITAKKIDISQKEIDTRINEFKQTLGPSANLNDFLTQRGITEQAFREQVRMQIGLEKLLAEKTKVSSKEIDDYVEKNLANLEAQGATDAAAQKKAAQEEIKRQKLNTEFEKWYTDIRKMAKVSIFIK